MLQQNIFKLKHDKNQTSIRDWCSRQLSIDESFRKIENDRKNLCNGRM